MRNENTDRLEEYGRRLVAAGFRVWLTPTTSRSGGYLTYERDGYWGHLQESYFDGWQHDMPLVPSRELGSSMFIGHPVEDVWSVEAAEQVARATNHNSVVGTRANAGDKTWLSSDSYPIHDMDTRDRLEYLRGEIRAERISQGELIELQSLASEIDPGDVELLEWAGAPEFPRH